MYEEVGAYLYLISMPSIEHTTTLGSLLVALGSPVLLQVTCEKENSTDTLRSSYLWIIYTCAQLLDIT